MTQGRLSSIEITTLSSAPNAVIGTVGNDSIGLKGSGNAILVSVNGVVTQMLPELPATPIIISGMGGTDTVTLNLPSGSSPALNLSNGSYSLALAASPPSLDPITLASLTIGTGASVSLPLVNGQSGHALLVVGSLAFDGPGSWLDLNGGDLILRTLSPSQSVEQLIGSASHQATMGIRFSSVADNSAVSARQSSLFTYGIVQNTSLTTFDSQPVSIGAVLIKHTYFGDSTLDGKVDGSDYSRIDNGFLTHSVGWANGDFNYDGVINASDYTLIDNAFNTQEPPFKPASLTWRLSL